VKSVLSLFIFLVASFILPFQVLALAPPTQISPSNGSTVTSPTLEWQASSGSLYSKDPYKVQIADNPGFISPKTPYYTSKTSYSPTTLSNTTWYWKVNVRDSNGNWSGWSSIWSFTLTTSTTSPTPTSSLSPTSTPSPSTTLSPTSQPASLFTISNIPSQINSDQSFNTSINLSLPENPNANFYLKGAFKKPDGSNYFGLTKVSESWIKNGSSYSNQNQITTDNSGNWSGNLEVKPDSDDSGFTGSGDYIFKVGRYTSSGSGPNWSNELTINISVTSQTPSPTTTKSPSPAPLTLPTPTSSSKTTTSFPKSSSKPTFKIASIAGVSTATESSSESIPAVRGQKQTNPVIWVGLVFILIGAGSIGYIYLQKNGKIPF